MGLKVVIDETDELSGIEARLASILEFVADDAERGVIYALTEWTKYAFVSDSEKYKPHLARIVYLSRREYLENGSQWETPNGKLPLHIPTNELVYSNNEFVRKGALEQQGLNATTALLLLAACGVEIALPNVSFNRESQEEIARIRDQLHEERLQYIEAISQLSDQSFDRIKSGDFNDIYLWARNESVLKILPKARYLQNKLTKLDKPLLERAGVMFWKEGIPTIGKALCDDGGKTALKVLAEEALKTLATTLSKSIEERRIPEASYILKLSRELL